MEPRAPRWLERLVAIAMPEEYRDEHLGDLEEGFRRRLSGAAGRRGASRWYLWQALQTVPYAMVIRLRIGRERKRIGGGGNMVESLLQDIRYGFRSLAKSPTFASVATLSLAMAIGVNTAIFSLVGVVVFAELPMADVESMAVVRSANPEMGIDQGSLSVSDYLNLIERTTSFDEISALTEDQWVLTGGDVPLRVTGYRVTANLTDGWRRPPVLGRGFAPGEDQPGAPAVVMISYPFWQSRFAGDPGVLGTTLRLDDVEYTIIGVTDPKIGFADFGRADVWAPLILDRGAPESAARAYFVSGRLKEGISQERATQEVAQIGRQLSEETPETHAGWELRSGPTLESMLGDEGKMIFSLLILTVTFVILLACANLANMMLARAAAREHEMSMRAALGARRSRLIRQLLTESFLISLAAAALGVGLAWGLLKAMVALSKGTEYVFLMAELSPVVLGFTLLLALVAPLAFGMIPALRASVAGAAGVLRDSRTTTGGRSSSRSRNFLVGAQVSLALALMIVAGLVTRTMVNIQTREVGFDARGILAMSLDLPDTQYPDPEVRRVFYEQTLDALSRLPSVSAVATTSVLPGATFGAQRGLDIEGRPLPPDMARPPIELATVSSEFFGLTGITVVRGRGFGPQDVDDAPDVVLISQEVAALHWPEENPVGMRVRLGGEQESWREIIGVVGDVSSVATNEGRPARMVWLPYSQNSRAAMRIVLRGSGDVGALAGPARDAVWSVDPNQPIDQITTLQDAQYRQNATGFALVSLFLTFAVFALVMAAIGIYGVMSYSVTQRRREIGLRMALGAQRSSVRMMIVRQGMIMVLAGIAVGLPIALGLGRMMQSVLYEVGATDPVLFGGVPLVLSLVALLASWVPALRATRTDPMRELREE